MQFDLVDNKAQVLYLWALLFSVALRFNVAVHFWRCSASQSCFVSQHYVVFLVLSCSIVFSVMVFPQASSGLLYPYLQFVHSVATVGGLNSNSQRSAHHMCSSAVVLLCSQWGVQFLVGVELYSPSLASLFDIWVVWGCYSLACLQSHWLILFASFFFLSFLCFHYYYYWYHYFPV